MTAKEAASHICCGEMCPRAYNCGIKKKYTLPLFGTNTTCPISRYNLPKERYVPKDVLDSIINRVELEDLYEICANCEHAEIKDGYIERDKCFESHCIDCPVYICEEGILETIAEASMS